jgi:hypothetical protein
MSLALPALEFQEFAFCEEFLGESLLSSVAFGRSYRHGDQRGRQVPTLWWPRLSERFCFRYELLKALY